MATGKIKWSTTYDRLKLNEGDGQMLITTGDYVIVKFRGDLFFYDDSDGTLIPMGQVLYARVTGGTAIW